MHPIDNPGRLALDNLLQMADESTKKLDQLLEAVREDTEEKHGRHYKGKLKTRQWWSKEEERSRHRKRIADASRRRNRY